MKGIDVQDFLHPIFVVSRITGVFPYDNKIDYHKIFCIFPVVNVLLNIGAICNFFVLNHSTSGLITTILDGVPLGISTTLLCCRSFLVRQQWIHFLDVTTSTERLLVEKGFRVTHKRGPMMADLCTRISFITIFCVHPFAMQLSPKEVFTRLYSVCIPLWFMSVIQLQFVFSVQALRNVCKSLRSALQVSDDKVPLLEMENLLIGASKELNKLYSIHGLIDLAYFFYDVCNGINVLIKSSNHVESGLIVLEILFYSFQLWRMTSVSSEFYNERMCGTFMSAKRYVTFTACGLFEINYEMMHSFVAGIGTYVALIQQINN